MLSDQEAHHARTVRRLQVDEAVVLFDGQGTEGAGRISEVGRDGVRVEIDTLRQREFDAPVQLTLAVAMPKGARQEFLIEKCTELGVASFWPMICKRNVARPSPTRLSKWMRTALEACKQSQRAHLPDIAEPQHLEGILRRCAEFNCCYVAHPTGSGPLGVTGTPGAKALILVGPEGGFSDSELTAAYSAGLISLSLGHTILRSETAAIAAAAKFLI